MKLALIVQFLVFALLFGNNAIAQRHYSFEEACQRGGWTTGPCAPKSEQRQQIERINVCGNAFHADKIFSCEVNATLSPVLDVEIFVELIGLLNTEKINNLNLVIYRSNEINGAVASFHNGYRVIVYNPEWAKAASAEA